MLKQFHFALILITALFAPVTAWSADAATLDEARVKEIVKEVIKENPQLIYDTVSQYARQQQQFEKKKQFEASFKNRRSEPLQDYHPSLGPEDAPIVIVEYTDFECSYCARVAGTLKALLESYPEQVRLVFRNNPLSMHPNALPAAKAALAAHKQGKFWPYHDLLFKNIGQLDEEKIVELAKELDLDMAQFDTDRKSDTIAQQVEMDVAQAKTNKFSATPMFLVNGVVVRGAQNKEYFSAVIDRLLAEKPTQ